VLAGTPNFLAKYVNGADVGNSGVFEAADNSIGLGKVTALQPVHYFWRVREFPGRHFGDSQAAGLIAQEVERVLPELVETDSDGYKAVNYSQLPLLTIQAVKELKAENDALKQRVAELERLDPQALTHRIAELERLVGVLLTAARR